MLRAAGMVLLAFALCAPWPARADAGAGGWREQASAYAADGQRLLYRELHVVQTGASPRRWVLYTCPDGRAFARKQVEGAGPAPDFVLEDGRDGAREAVTGDGAQRRLLAHGARASRPLPVPADGVIDAGFDAAVRQAWPRLLRGERVRFQFLVPSRGQFYPVWVERTGSTRWRGQAAERLRLRLDTWFGFALPELGLVYSGDGTRLLEFAGTSNLRDARGRNPQVRIVFDGARTPLPAPDADAAALAARPLDGRCPF